MDYHRAISSSIDRQLLSTVWNPKSSMQKHAKGSRTTYQDAFIIGTTHKEDCAYLAQYREISVIDKATTRDWGSSLSMTCLYVILAEMPRQRWHWNFGFH